MNRITYPSGRVVTYGFDAAGRVSSVSLDGVTVLNNVGYQPFGPPTGWSWGNGTAHQRYYDLDGRVNAIVFPPEGADQQSFGYDALSRLTAAALTASGVNLAYQYDATGNRTQETRNAQTNTYATFATSNRLQSIAGGVNRQPNYNANGSVTADNANTFTYDGRERLVGANATAYYVSGLEQRIEKAGPGATAASGVQQFLYDEQGRLIGEYDAANGTAVAEHIYLNDWPVGVIVGNTLYYVHPDHLGAPRTITLPATNQSVWTWQREPFSNNPPNSNPNGLGTFLYNLRFPGQYFDSETGLHYNYMRDYDPSIGRYVESDPIGLKGGINTYDYVKGNALTRIDPLGLADCCQSMTENACCNSPQALEVLSIYDGTVMCCAGRATICVKPAGAYLGGERVRRCLVKHERKHLDHIQPCQCNSRPEPARPTIPRADAECEAVQVEMECLQEALADCGNDVNCQTQIWLRMRSIWRYGNSFGKNCIKDPR